ncbi:MAG TPA: terminase family protein [Stellaceae bacterium]|nr:terminase family protein [Stellaceae bacterium]
MRGSRSAAYGKILMNDSEAAQLADALSLAEHAEAVDRLDAAQQGRMLDDWEFWARPNQLPPPGDWRVWLLLAGRGFGKTRSGAEFVRARVESGLASRVALVGPTASDVRDVMIEGESGLLAISGEDWRPAYEPSKRRLTWPNGAVALAFSADEPERLRGPQHDLAWCDELAAWRYAAAWDNLLLGLRLGSDPRAVVTTTPKPNRLVRDVLASPGTVVTRGSTFDNAANLAPAFLDTVVRRYQGTRLGRQELEAELLDDVPGALWSRDAIEAARVTAAPDLSRIVVAIDPAASSGEGADETGIVVAGLAHDGRVYVLDDLSGRMSPRAWALKAIAAYRKFAADRIVAEINNGGEMVEATLRSVQSDAPFRALRASRGKAVRAEPVAALYEQGRVHHVGGLPALEDQLCAFTADFDRAASGTSPDRLDALVWAVTDLMANRDAAILDYYRGLAGAQ